MNAAIVPVRRSDFDVEKIRRDFPILHQQVNGKPLVYLDNAASSQRPRSVIDAIDYYYEHDHANVHRGVHTLSQRATDAYEGARETMRGFINARSTREIIYVRGTTEAINLVAQSYARPRLQPGDEILISALEHHANIVPWQLVCEQTGAQLKVIPITQSGEVDFAAFERLLGPRTRLLALAHISNALGTIVPVEKFIARAKEREVPVLLDGAQAVPHSGVDVQTLGCDFYCFSAHKMLGPTGIGVLYGRESLLEAMPPWQGGGSMIKDVTFEKSVFQHPPEKFEAGTGTIADAVGLGAAIDYLERIGMANIAAYEHGLLEYALEGLRTVPGLKLVGAPRERAGAISLVLDEIRVEDVGQALNQDGIAVRAGHHCAQPILRRFGYETTVRPSFALYNTPEDVDALVAALHRLSAERGRRGY
jgi:cysteine desulfurase / selenocysteine lyase